jgi:hypothetical protein
MMHAAIPLVALAAFAAACTAAPPRSTAELVYPRTVGAPQTLRWPRGETVIVQPGEAKPAARVQCTLTLREGQRADQQMITIGAGETEALTCGSLKSAGIAPAPLPAQRIALIYSAFGPHAGGRQVAILYRPGPGSDWQLEEELAQRIADQPALNSLAKIQRWLAAMQ